MAVGIRIKIAGVSAEQFDRLNAAVDPDSNPPDGLIFHASGPVDGGWGVLDFWGVARAFRPLRAGTHRILDGGRRHRGKTVLEIHEFPVHEHFPR